MTLRLFRRCRRRLYRCHRLVVVVKVVFIAVIVVVVVVVFIVVIVVVLIVDVVVVVVIVVVIIVVVVKVNASTQNASKLIGIRQRGRSYAVRVLADRRGGLPRSAFDTERTTASARQTCGAPEIRLLHKLASVAIVYVCDQLDQGG